MGLHINKAQVEVAEENNPIP